MIESKELYQGVPFVGIQITTSDRNQNDRGVRTYCLLQPSSETEIGGMHGIPFDSDPEHPWLRGLEGLAATVVQNYGSNYKNNITFEPPQPQKTGSDEHGLCTRRYESLSRNELDKFYEAVNAWIQQHPE